MSSPKERQALAVIADYIKENHHGVEWGTAIDYSGIEFEWPKHPRLIRAQTFDDPDYVAAIRGALTDIFSKDVNALRSVLAYIFNGKVPESPLIIQAFQNLGLIEGTARDILVSFGSLAAQGLSRLIEVNPIFTRRGMAVDDQLVFMLMPFRPNFERIYADCIQPTLTSLGLSPMKANDIFDVGPIVEDVWEHIMKAKFIVADVTGKNPNVFYELGIAHTLGKDVILMSQSEDDVPFDLRHLRYFTYSDNAAGWTKLKTDLEKVTRAIISR